MGRSIYKLVISVFIVSLLGMGTAHARFLQTDPVGYEGGQNLYAYVENDPVNLVDPDGKKPESVMDQMYVYPRLTPEQKKLVEAQHYEIGETAFNGMVTGATLVIPGGITIKGARAISAYRAYYVTKNAKTGLTVFQTKSIAGFFGKGVKGAEAALSKIGQKGFKLPKGVSERTLQQYKKVAERAIEKGKTPEVQQARIKVIDEALKKIKE